LNECRSTSVVVEDPTDFGNGASEDIVAHEGVSPNRRDQLIFGEYLVRMGGELNQDLHDLGFEVDRFLPFLHRVELRLNFPVPDMKTTLQRE